MTTGDTTADLVESGEVIVAADTREAAELLHLTADGVRDRIERGKLQATRHPTTGRYSDILIPRVAIQEREEEFAREAAGDPAGTLQAALAVERTENAALHAQIELLREQVASYREQADYLRNALTNEQSIRMVEAQNQKALLDQRPAPAEEPKKPRLTGWQRFWRGL